MLFRSTGYTSDFTVTGFSQSLGGGSGLVLSAKLNSVLKYYGNATLDITRISDSATDSYSTVGVARFLRYQNTSTTNKIAGFIINADGNGSIALNMGSGSNLDADLLDGQNGTWYLDGNNFSDGTVVPSKLQNGGTYPISISNQSGNTLRLNTSQASDDPLPSITSEGVVCVTRSNSANGLSDGGTRNLVLNLKNGIDASFGGARQLAFTDNNNLWIRGSGTGLSVWGSWAKVWTSVNDASAGTSSGPDAWKFNNKTSQFYNTAYNITYGVLSNNRIPSYFTSKSFDDNVTVRYQSGAIGYEFYCPGVVLSGAATVGNPYTIGNTVKLFRNDGTENGQFIVEAVTPYTNADTSLQYTIIKAKIGRAHV